MSDVLFGTDTGEEELDAILDEVRGGNEKPADEEPARTWSMDDIDRLIADSNGEDYVPSQQKKTEDSEKFKRFFPDEFDESLFSIQPITEDAPEMQDVSSGEAPEVDGQETFFEEDDMFDFDIETVIMPDDPGEEKPIKYNNKTTQPDPLPPAIEEQLPQVEPAAEETPVQEAPAAAEVPHEDGHIDYRAMFYRKLKLEEIEDPSAEEPEPDGPVDVSGIVVQKSASEGEGDLEPLPKVMAAEDFKQQDEEKTKIVPLRPADLIPKKTDDTVEGQIILNGFGEVPDESRPEKQTAGEVEQDLSARRKQKVDGFTIEDFEEDDFSPEFDEIPDNDIDIPDVDEKTAAEPHKDASLIETIGEYSEPGDKNRIHQHLTEAVKKAKRSVIAIGVIDALLLILALIPVISETLSLESSIFHRESMILCVINAVLIIAGAALDSEEFFDSFTSLFKGKINGSTAVALSVAVALVENTIAAITGAKAAVFGVVAVFGIFVSKFTDYIDAKRILSNFSVCAYSYEHNMYAVHAFDNESEVFELGRGLLMGNAEMLYSSSISFPSDFIENSGKKRVNDKYAKIMLICGAAASLIAGIAVGIHEREFMMGFATFAGAFCLTSPIFSKFIPSFITYITDSRLNHEGSMIVNLDEAEKAAGANAVVLDSADIFDRSACTMHGMKDFHTLRTDVVLLYASAMVIKSGGPLKECFENVVDGRQDLLPPVKELVYEDKMGVSARIFDQKVLLGNRNMLIHHNIEAPDKSFEEKYIHHGRKVIYLACNEQLAAMFVVSYRVDENMKQYMKQLESNGIQVLVRTNDVNVTEELISEKFGIKQENFKILSSVAGRLFKRRKDAVTDRLPAGIIHDGEAYSMLRTICAACSMASKSKLGNIIQIALMVISLALSVVIGISAQFGLTAAFAVLILIVETGSLVGLLMLGKK